MGDASKGESSMSEAEYEEFKVSGEELLAKVKELVHEGNVRRVIMANEEGKTLIEVPLTVGVVGALLLPVWVAVGAIAAVVTDCTIRIERADDEAEEVDNG
jgi:hypothetical protein